MSFTKAYHYTTFQRALMILDDGVLQLSVPPVGSGKLLAVRFTTNAVRDPGMRTHFIDRLTGKGRLGVSRDETSANLGLASFITDHANPTPLHEALADNPKLYARYPPGTVRIGANIREWLVAPKPMTLRERCRGAVLWMGGEWVEMTQETAAEMLERLPDSEAGYAAILAHRPHRRVPTKRKRKS